MQKFLLRKGASSRLRRIVALSCIFMMSFGTGLQAAAQQQADQNPRVTVQGTDVSIRSLLNEIEKQTGFVFFYNTQSIDVQKRVTVNADNRNMSDVIGMLFGRNAVSYKIMGKQIALYPSNGTAPTDDEMARQANALPGQNARQQPAATAQKSGPATVTGRITDEETGEALAFSTITLKGTTIGVMSDDNGEYSIQIPDGQRPVMVFSQLGYASREITYDGKSTLVNVRMEKETMMIENLIVTGYQNIKKETFTGSSVKITAEELNVAGVTDVSRMLEGKVAGVSIQNVSGTFGAAPKVRVRGATSIRGENKPLWVVDGVVLEDIVNISNDQLSSGDPTTLLGSSVAGINSSDIESFDVLKDAAATALYGARAMNGVIVITTKRGKQGTPTISYSGNFTMRSKPRYSQFDIMNSADQMALYTELQSKGGLSERILNQAKSGPYGLMYTYLGTPDPVTGKLLTNTPEARAEFLYRYAKANTDWFDLLFTNSLMQEHSLSISSGTDKSRTYVSLGFLNDAGATIADKVNRYTVNFRNDLNLGEKITMGFNVNASVRNQRTPGSFTRELDQVRGEYARDFDINPFSYSYNTSRAVRPYNELGQREYVMMNYAPFNILNELDNNTIDLTVVDIKAQAEFNYTIAKGLKYSFMGALRYVNSAQDHMIRPNSNVAMAYRAIGNSTVAQNNPYLWHDLDDTSGKKEGVSVLPQGGFYNTHINEMLHYNVRNSLSYDKVWNCERLHELNILAGVEAKYTDRKINQESLIGYMFDGSNPLPDPNYYKMMSQRQISPGNVTNSYDRFAAFYATAHYTFDRRYSVDATFRYDGSNALGAATTARWLPTWNVGGKWIISNEAFMENVEFIDNLSLRLSYGLNATMPPTVNSKAIYYASKNFAPGYSQDVIELSRLANINLTWEKSYLFNAGLDVSFLNGRLSLYVDYFNRRSFDLIDLVKTSGVGGELYKYANYADLESSGIDITVGGKPISTKDWTLSMNFTFGYSTNAIRNAKNVPQMYELVRAEGGNLNDYAVNSLFSIPFAGLDPETGIPLFYQPDGSIGMGADMQSMDTGYLKHEGQIDPKFTGGLNTTLRWKSLTFNIFFSYQWGNMVRLTPVFKSNVTDLDATSKALNNRWMTTGDELTTNIPALVDKVASDVNDLTSVYPYVNYNYSSERVAKGDFIRLKTISLNYDLPADWLQKSKFFRSASVRFTGKDLWLLYSDKKLNGQDPEFFNTGGVAMPVMPQYVFTLSLGF